MAVELASRLRTVLTDNLNLKVLSLGFALVLFALVHGQDTLRTITVDVDVQVPPEKDNRILITQLPPMHVTVRGPSGLLDDLRPSDLIVRKDLRDGTKTQVTYDASMLHLPPGVKVEQISPSEPFPLQWENVEVRDVPVKVSVTGACAPGFMVKGTPVPDPANVRVRGPHSEVIVLQYMRAEPFDVAGLKEGQYTHPLGFELETSPRVTPEAKSVDVTVEIVRETIDKTFTKIPVAVVGSAKAKTQPAEIDVRLTCPPDVLRPLRPEQIVPHVQFSSTAEHGSEALPVQFTLDPCAVALTPSTVIVKW